MQIKEKIKRFYEDHEDTIVLVTTFGTVYVIGYVAGRYDGRDYHKLTGAGLFRKSEDDKNAYLVVNTKRRVNTYDFQFND